MAYKRISMTSRYLDNVERIPHSWIKVDFLDEISYLGPASDNPPFMQPVIVNRFPNPDINSLNSSLQEPSKNIITATSKSTHLIKNLYCAKAKFLKFLVEATLYAESLKPLISFLAFLVQKL